ncbi:MAG TPA: hypothetical protein VFZ47_03550 [Chitinophagaceae bacterium]
MKHNDLVKLFEHAIRIKAPGEVEDAVNATYTMDQPDDFVPYLVQLLESPWHFDHEDIASLLQHIAAPETVDVLFKIATTKFEYLDYNDSKPLARKCTWALADIGSNKAKEALIELSKNQDSEIAAFAQKRIDNWESEARRKKHLNL